MKSLKFTGTRFTFLLVGAIPLIFIVVSKTCNISSQCKQQTSTIVPIAPAPIRSVVALGRIEPEGFPIKLSVANAKNSRVNQLFVKEGDRVKEGQLIATLQGIKNKQAAIVEAEKNVAVFQARLQQAEIGANTASNLAAQKALIEQLTAQLQTQQIEKQAAIDRDRAELGNAESQYKRYQKLYQLGAISTSERDIRRKNRDTARSQLKEAFARVNNIERTLMAQIKQETAKLKQLIIK